MFAYENNCYCTKTHVVLTVSTRRVVNIISLTRISINETKGRRHALRIKIIRKESNKKNLRTLYKCTHLLKRWSQMAFQRVQVNCLHKVLI